MLNEKKNITYKYSSTQIDFPKVFADEVISWSNKNIKEEDLDMLEDGSGGREDEIHCTLLYGIVEENPNRTKKIIEKFNPFIVELGSISKFDSKDYDVIKVEVKSKSLEKYHYFMRKHIENENSYPEYQAHMTLAYVKKDSYNHLIGDNYFNGKKFRVRGITFSSSNGNKETIRID